MLALGTKFLFILDIYGFYLRKYTASNFIQNGA